MRFIQTLSQPVTPLLIAGLAASVSPSAWAGKTSRPPAYRMILAQATPDSSPTATPSVAAPPETPPPPPPEAPTPPSTLLPANPPVLPPPVASNVPPSGAIRPDPAGEPALRLSLADALNLALDENPGVGAVADRIGRAQARVREIGAAVQPQLSALGTITHQGPISSVTFPGANGQPGQSIQLGKPTTKTVVFNAQKNLDIGRLNRISRDVARLGITSAELDLAKAQNDLLLSIYSTYYSVLRADQSVGVQQEAIADAQEQLRVANAQFQAGTAAEFDVLRASVQVENLRQDLETAQKNSSLSRANLLNALGIDPNTPIEIEPVALPTPSVSRVSVSAPANGGGTQGATPTGQLPGGVGANGAIPIPTAADVVVPTDLPLDLTTALDEAYTARPEVQSALTTVRTAERNVDFARRGKRPEVTLNGQYLYSPDVAGFSTFKGSWSLNAQLTVPIFEGGATRARVDEALSDVKSARNTLDQARQSVALDVRSALLNLQESVRRRQTAAANVVQAREAVRIAQVRFQAGVSTTVEVTDAQVALTQAQNNQVNADFDYLTAEAQLRKSIGRLVPETTRAQVQNKPGPPPPTPEDVDSHLPKESRPLRRTGTPAKPATTHPDVTPNESPSSGPTPSPVSTPAAPAASGAASQGSVPSPPSTPTSSETPVSGASQGKEASP